MDTRACARGNHCLATMPKWMPVMVVVLLSGLPSVQAATLDVRNYGAVANDTTDDRTAIQAAINAAAAGDTVSVPAGTWLVNASLSLKTGVKLKGSGSAQTTLKYNSSSEFTIIVLDSVNNVEVSDLTLDGNNTTAASSAIFGYKGRGHFLHHIAIKDYGSNANGPIAIHFTGDGGNLTNANGVTDSVISDNTITNIGVASMWGGGIRMSWNSSRNKILRNTIDNTGRGGIFGNDNSSDLIIQKNTVTRSGRTSEKLGIEVWNLCDRCVIEDNAIDHWLSIGGSNFVAVRRNTIRDLSTNLADTAFIGIEAIGHDCVITDNMVDHGQHIGLSVSGVFTNYKQFYAYNTFQYMHQWGCQLYAEGSDGIHNLYFFKNKFNNTLRNTGNAPYPPADGRGFFFNAASSMTRHITFEANDFSNNALEGLFFSNVDQVSVVGNTITGNAGGASTGYPGVDLEWSGNTVSGNANNTQPASRGYADPKPTASFSAPATVLPGQAVTFTNTSTDTGGSIASALWDFGDGVPSSTISPTYTYATAGTYRVTLLVWDNGGRGARVEKTITVGTPADTISPTVSMTAPANNSTVSGTITLSANASDNVGVIGVQFKVDGVNAGAEDTATPYSVPYNATGLSVGNHSITAIARDAAGNSTVSAPVTITIAAPPPPSDFIYLSDLTWASMTNGWGPAERDRSNGETAAADGTTIKLNGVSYSKGLGAHAASDIRYNLAGQYTTFVSDIGLDDEVGASGSVIFEVWCDGAKVFDSGVMTGTSATKTVTLNISGKNELRLVITDAGDGGSSDHADWAGARVRRGNGSGTGLKGEYYNNRDFTALTRIRTDATINFSWGSGSPDAAIGVDTFSVRWTGLIEARYTQTYSFYTVSDDGVRLWINNQLVINNWTDHADTENRGTIDLVAGRLYSIRMDFYENGGGATAKLLWSSGSQAKEIVPTGYLYPPTAATVQAAAASAVDQDADGDGLIDAYELSVGLDPSKIDTDDDGESDGDELTYSGIPHSQAQYAWLDSQNAPPPIGPVVTELTITKLTAAVSYTRDGRDTCAISGELPDSIRAGNVAVDIGGATATFLLDANGRARSSMGTLQFLEKDGFTAFKLSLKGDLKSAWLDNGVDPEASGVTSISLPVRLTCDSNVYATNVTVQLISVARKRGRIKN